MATGINYDGRVVNVNDQVTIMGSINTVSGSGGGATVTVIPQRALASGSISCKANDMNAASRPYDSDHVARSISGVSFGAAGENVSVMGTVTGISGSGGNAVLTVTLCNSGNSVTVPAGSVRSLQFNG